MLTLHTRAESYGSTSEGAGKEFATDEPFKAFHFVLALPGGAARRIIPISVARFCEKNAGKQIASPFGFIFPRIMSASFEDVAVLASESKSDQERSGAPMPPRRLLAAHDAADLPLATAKPWLACGIARSQWFKLAASGRTPPPTARLGTRRPVWAIAELAAWLEAGAPDREEWERQKREK
jgi:predicted DNA-binding transcriptional regulator AlpA